MAETVETLKAKAIQATGLNDFGGDWFEQPLAAWAEDLAGPSLTEPGRAFLGRLAVTNLCRRLEVVDWWNRHPEIEDVAMPPILYITGLERSGTTLLHNLLALYPLLRALLRWELMRPAPPPEASSYRTDPRIAEVQASVDRLRGTLLERACTG
jgi:Sulfotransferase family